MGVHSLLSHRFHQRKSAANPIPLLYTTCEVSGSLELFNVHAIRFQKPLSKFKALNNAVPRSAIPIVPVVRVRFHFLISFLMMFVYYL